MSIFSYVSSLIKSFKKNDILLSLEDNDKKLDLIIDSLELANKDLKGYSVKSPISKNLLSRFKYNFNGTIKTDPLSDFIFKINQMVKNAKSINQEMKRQISTKFDSVTIKGSLTVKKATILNIIDSISFISNLTLTFIEYIVHNERQHLSISKENYDIPLYPIKYSRLIENNIPYLGRVYSLFDKDVNQLQKELDKLPNVLLDVKNKELLESAYNITSHLTYYDKRPRFVGNPIFHIRMMFAEWSAERYKKLQDEKKLLELKIIQLKNMRTGEHNTTLEKQIKAYEDMVINTEKKIHDLEESVK